MHETAVGNPDADFSKEAIDAIKNLQSVAQLRTFQSAMGKGAAGKWEWHDLVSEEVRKALPKEEAKRQSYVSSPWNLWIYSDLRMLGLSLNLSKERWHMSRIWKISKS